MGAGRPFAWEKSYPAGVRWDAPIATSTIPKLLDRAVAQFGDRAALEYRDRRISYRELAASADRAAAAFLRLGTNAPVALYLPNTPYRPVSFFGAMCAGKCAVHLSPLDAVGHYFKRVSIIDTLFGDADHHLAELARVGGLIAAA